MVRLGHAEPALVVLQFLAGLLREQIVGSTHRQLAALGQFQADGVVVRIRLPAAAGVDGAGLAQAVQFGVILLRGVELLRARQHTVVLPSVV